MILRNTSRYPIEEVRRLLEIAAADRDLRRVAVNVKNCGAAYAGRAYFSVPRVSSVAASATRLVVLRIGAPERFPADNVRTVARWVEAPPPSPDFTPEQNRAYWQEHRAWMRTVGGKSEAYRYQRRIVERHPYGGKGSPLIEMRDWREGLVALAAHEFEHIRQFDNGLSRSEVQAEKVAAKRLAEYRKMRAERPGRPIW